MFPKRRHFYPAQQLPTSEPHAVAMPAILVLPANREVFLLTMQTRRRITLKPTALAAGHYECRSLKQSLPILQDLLALEVITTSGDDAVLKHPNTGWKLIAHDSSPDAPDKPFQHHYGVRVATNGEIDRAHEYLQSKKREYKIKIIQPKENHNAYSVNFFDGPLRHAHRLHTAFQRTQPAQA
jgi:hypothetical protein